MRLAGIVTIVTALAASPRARADDAPRNENTAVTLSGAATGGSVALVAIGAMMSCSSCDTKNNIGAVVLGTGIAGLVLGPSFGQWYAGRGFTPGLGMRIGGAAAMAVGAWLAIVAADSEGPTSASGPIGVGAFIGGAVLFVAGTVHDIATAKRSARRYNENHAAVRLVPTLLTPPSGPVMGLGLGGSF